MVVRGAYLGVWSVWCNKRQPSSRISRPDMGHEAVMARHDTELREVRGQLLVWWRAIVTEVMGETTRIW